MPWKNAEAQRKWRRENTELTHQQNVRSWQRIKNDPVKWKKRQANLHRHYWKDIEKSREKSRIDSSEYRKKYPERRKISCAKWDKKNPEKVLAKSQRHLRKIGREMDLTVNGLIAAFQGWSSFVRQRDNHVCFCGAPAAFAHHIIHKATYPTLSLNLNNGISLCDRCHNEVHGNKLWSYMPKGCVEIAIRIKH